MVGAFFNNDWMPLIFNSTNKDLFEIRSLPLRKFFDLQFFTIWKILRDKACKLINNEMILDFGAGNSPYRELFNSKITYYTLDSQIKCDYGDLFDIPTGRKFNVILLIEVLEHIEDPVQLLKALQSFLLPNGEIWISVPFNARIHQAPSDYWRWAPDGIKKMIGKANLSLKELIYRGNDLCSITNKLNFFFFRGIKNFLIFPLAILMIVMVSCPLLLISHISLKFALVSSDDPLGFFAICKKN